MFSYCFKTKLEKARQTKSSEWTMQDLEGVLGKLGQNKSTDPNGFNRSIFHLNCIGDNLKESLLVMFNKLKNQGTIPSFMKKATISTIPKPGSKFLLKNERGIFVLSAIRSIFMRLIYNTKYETLKSNMSDSNIGGRKEKSSINHIFVINGIIHEALSTKKNKSVTLQIFDYTQMFDSMVLKETISDLYDSGIKDDTLTLLYEANRNVKVRVKTPYGLTVENTLDEIVLQGDTWGPPMAANQVDSFGKQLLKEEPEYIYKYKGYIPIGVLGMIDDLVGVSESGVNAVKLNAFINVKTAEKKLQFGSNKCHTMTIAHKNARNVKSDLFIDVWSENHDEKDHLIEKLEGKVKMQSVSEQKYLGFILSDDGSNMKNIFEKQKRANGIIREIQYLIKGLGKYTIEGALIYLNSLLRSSILFAAEAMYNLKENEVRVLERIEENLLRKIFNT